MSASIELYDPWLDEAGPAALVIREYLAAVEGPGGVVFPATFASGDGFKGGYNIDTFPNGTSVCLIDSIGSQANRVEPLFASMAYAELVPQIVVIAGDRNVNLLEAGHRAGDAIVRCSSLQRELSDAFRAVLKGDAEPLARIAPTSLVFGVWDSRDTQAKLPRLIASTIRAYNVRELRRSAQYVPAVAYVEEGLLDDPADKKAKDAYAERGFVHVPASASHGGVIVDGEIRRDAVLQLVALRQLCAGSPARTLTLRRYILGLALTAFTAPRSGYLRQGCNLVQDGRPVETKSVAYDGTRQDVALTHEAAVAFAREAARAFGVGPSREVPFDRELAKNDVAGEGAGKKSKKAAAKK